MTNRNTTSARAQDHRTTAAVFNVISRSSMMLVIGILVWGFNKIDRSLEEMNATLTQVQVTIGRLETERDIVRDKLNAVDIRIVDIERSLRQR